MFYVLLFISIITKRVVKTDDPIDDEMVMQVSLRLEINTLSVYEIVFKT